MMFFFMALVVGGVKHLVRCQQEPHTSEDVVAVVAEVALHIGIGPAVLELDCIDIGHGVVVDRVEKVNGRLGGPLVEHYRVLGHGLEQLRNLRTPWVHAFLIEDLARHLGAYERVHLAGGVFLGLVPLAVLVRNPGLQQVPDVDIQVVAHDHALEHDGQGEGVAAVVGIDVAHVSCPDVVGTAARKDAADLDVGVRELHVHQSGQGSGAAL